mgnify:CR=1 FL=1
MTDEQRIVELEKRVTALEQQITLSSEWVSAEEVADMVSRKIAEMTKSRN